MRKQIELPYRFKTWVEFYNHLEKEGLTNYSEVFVLPKLKFGPSDVQEKIHGASYNMNEIKAMTFNELWEERKMASGLNREDLEFIIGCLESNTSYYRGHASVEVIRKIEFALKKINDLD